MYYKFIVEVESLVNRQNKTRKKKERGNKNEKKL